MCGLLGFASTEAMKNRDMRRLFFRTGFPLLALDRGMESSGIALVENEQATPLVYKKALWGGDFLQQWQTARYLNDIEKYKVAIGHVRASTRGTVNDFNAHPFQYDHITLVHNGHIRNAGQLDGADKADSVVDSAQVAYSMAKNGELETLQKVEGGFVFVWWNSNTQKLNIARNLARPLYMAYLSKENSFFWASEMTHLLHLLRNESISDEGLLIPGENIWYQYDLKDLRRYEKVPFATSQGRLPLQQPSKSLRGSNANGPIGDQTGSSNYRGWTDEEWDRWGEYVTEHITKADRSALSTTGNEIDEIREQIRNQRHKDAKQSGIPTSKKRIARAKDELRKLGLAYEQLITCNPQSWHKYRNQRALGSMLATRRGQTQSSPIVEVIGIEEGLMSILFTHKVVLVECRNVRNGADGHIRVVGTLSPKMHVYLAKKEQELKDKAEQANTEETKSALVLERDHDGPGGQKVTLQRFRELVVGGCANCQRDIDPNQHGAILWVGTPSVPICHSCQTPGILESIGFPDHLKASLVH